MFFKVIKLLLFIVASFIFAAAVAPGSRAVPREAWAQRAAEQVEFGSFTAPSAIAGENPIQIENAKAGTTDWQLTNYAANHEIEGYASLTSVNRGGQISFFVNTHDPYYTFEVFRLGWYAGKGGRRMIPAIRLQGMAQPIPTPDPNTGLIECAWSKPYVLTTANRKDPSDWVTGVYLVKLTGETSLKQSYIIFVVRDDSRGSDLLYQSSVNTFQAYNEWGGKSLYVGPVPYFKVSFNRPYIRGEGTGDFLAFEITMVRFLEREGYDVAYCTDVDTHANSGLLLSHKGFLVVGHDEYWSWEMRTNVRNARDRGVNLGFFTANTCFWQVRFEPSTVDHAANRTLVGYKQHASLDPAAANPATFYLITTRWRDPHATLGGNPEEALIGVMYNAASPARGDIVIGNTSSWVFAGTGLHPGDHLKGLLGYEVDQTDQIPGFAPPPGTVLLTHSPYLFKDNTYYSDMTVYQTASGANVFATGSIFWDQGLDSYRLPIYQSFLPPPTNVSPAAQQITRNVLGRFINPPKPLPFASAVLSPLSVDFGSQVPGTTSPMLNAILTNNKSSVLNLKGIIVNGDFKLTASTCGSAVAAHAACAMRLDFTPATLGTHTGALSVSDDSTGSPQTVALTGNGVNPVEVAPTTIDFGKENVGTYHAAHTASLENYQTGTLKITGIAIGGADKGDFILTTSTCSKPPVTLGTGQTCMYSLTFKPGAAGIRSATLMINDNPDANTPEQVQLKGTGVNPPPTPGPTITASPS